MSATQPRENNRNYVNSRMKVAWRYFKLRVTVACTRNELVKHEFRNHNHQKIQK